MIGKLTIYILVFVTQMIVWVCQTNEIYSVPYRSTLQFRLLWRHGCVQTRFNTFALSCIVCRVSRLIFGVGLSLLYMFQKPSISQNETCKRILNSGRKLLSHRTI